jgi:hypothetical protein
MDYIVCMRRARPSQPYHVLCLERSFFKNYDKLSSNFNSIRPGKKAGDAVVTDIHALRYVPSGEVFYKLRHIDTWSLLPNRRNTAKHYVPKNLYTKPVNISADKFKSLQELKACIPKEYHTFYDNLSHD